MKLTTKGQRVIELLCDKVTQAGPGFHYWLLSIGKEATVVKWLAKKEGTTVKSMAGIVAHLVATRHLFRNPSYSTDPLEITEQGWQAWSKFEPGAVFINGDGCNGYIELDLEKANIFRLRNPS